MRISAAIFSLMPFDKFAIGASVIFFMCGCNKMRDSSDPAPFCFEAKATNTSIQTQNVFKKRNCQGGGVTWSPILTEIIKSKGTLEDYVYKDANGLLGSAYIFNGLVKVAIDDEGDAALFCSSDPLLTDAIKDIYAKANADTSILHSYMSKSSALLMECLEEDGSLPKLPKVYNSNNQEVTIPDSLYLQSK